jgi:hypothetical protein
VPIPAVKGQDSIAKRIDDTVKKNRGLALFAITLNFHNFIVS